MGCESKWKRDPESREYCANKKGGELEESNSLLLLSARHVSTLDIIYHAALQGCSRCFRNALQTANPHMQLLPSSDSSILIEPPQAATSNFGVYFVLALSNSLFFSSQSFNTLCSASTPTNFSFNALTSSLFPNSVLSTIRFASVSAFAPSSSVACCSAASASGRRPRCSSDTAWATRECEDWVCAVWASSSKT